MKLGFSALNPQQARLVAEREQRRLKVVAAIEAAPDGLTVAELMPMIGAKENAILRLIRDSPGIAKVKVGKNIFWVTEDRVLPLIQKRRADYIKRKQEYEARRVRPKRPPRVVKPKRVWPETVSYEPPGPRIASVWDLSRVLEAA